MVSNLDVLKKAGSDAVKSLKYIVKYIPAAVSFGYTAPTFVRKRPDFHKDKEVNVMLGIVLGTGLHGLATVMATAGRLDSDSILPYILYPLPLAINMASLLYEGFRWYFQGVKEELEISNKEPKKPSKLENEVETTEIEPNKFVNPWEIEIKD